MPALRYARTVIIIVTLTSSTLFSQFILKGVVSDNDSQPVKYALVELIDENDSSQKFSSYTNESGKYTIQITTRVEDNQNQIPSGITLNQNYPNPFNPSTVISWDLHQAAYTNVSVYNLLGQKVKTLYNRIQPSGIGNVVWDATDDFGSGVPAGIYFYSLQTEEIKIVKKMLLMDSGEGKSMNRSNSNINNFNYSALNKPVMSQYLLRVSGNDIETLEKPHLEITNNMVLDISVTRRDVNLSNAAYELLGIYPGFGGAWPDPEVCVGVDNFLNFEEWLGRTMTYVNLNFGDWSWPDFEGSAASIINSENGFVRVLPGVIPCFITPLGVRELIMIDGTYYNADTEMGVNLRKTMFTQISDGKYDQYYQKIASDLQSRDAEHAIIRLGHEFDLIYYPWSIVGGNHEEYKNAFRHIVSVMKEIIPELQFCYNWTGEGDKINPDDPGKTFAESAYPGDEFVDVIGVDVYDSRTWAENLKDLNHARDMAILHQKPLAIPEWGLWHNHLYPGKPGNEDNPVFIQNMVDYMNALPINDGGHLSFHCYFQQLPDHDIFTFPKSKELFIELFGKSSE